MTEPRVEVALDPGAALGAVRDRLAGAGLDAAAARVEDAAGGSRVVPSAAEGAGDWLTDRAARRDLPLPAGRAKLEAAERLGPARRGGRPHARPPRARVHARPPGRDVPPARADPALRRRA